MEKRAIVWFRNDLRIRDNSVLSKAALSAKEIIPVFCFDPRWYRELDLGFKKTGALRTRFLLESLVDLKSSLRQLGSDLVILMGRPEVEIAQLAARMNANRVFASKEVTREELQVEEGLEKSLFEQNQDLELLWQSTLFHEDDIPWPINRLPDVFTRFRKENEKFTAIREEVESPKTLNPLPENLPTKLPSLEELGFENEPEIDEKAAIQFEGGENAAWQRLDDYFWKESHLKAYKYTRNGLLGLNYSSKFSAWLALGCISPRSIYYEVKNYERDVKKNSSTYWLIFELIWRDYFRFVCKRYGHLVFQKGGIKAEQHAYKNYKPAFDRWIRGQTGIPFIDANMRELAMTGFMSNRGRQNVASFLVKDLDIDWRWGAAWFESRLIDYDVCSNWGNWMYVAGVGNDPRENRYFNIISQAQKYDSKGDFVRHWIPELSEIPGFKVHHPAELSRTELSNYMVELGVDYPNPLVSFSKWMVS